LEKNVQSSEPRPALAAAEPFAQPGPEGENPRERPEVAALTRRMTEGDEMAWRTFYDAYFDRLWRYLLVVAAGNEDAAREALQLALLRVVRHVKAFETEEIFWSWLTVLARSAFADETRKRRRYFAFLERFTRHQDTGPSAMGNGEADEQLRALLESQLTALPENERQLVERKYILRQSVREIADGQQTTEKAVESRLSRIRRKLKDAVLDELKNENSWNA
jgi:RNA polymerase sigma-70 factor, ECF subfamily